jgi:hypothetical protein
MRTNQAVLMRQRSARRLAQLQQGTINANHYERNGHRDECECPGSLPHDGLVQVDVVVASWCRLHVSTAGLISGVVARHPMYVGSEQHNTSEMGLEMTGLSRYITWYWIH